MHYSRGMPRSLRLRGAKTRIDDDNVAAVAVLDRCSLHAAPPVSVPDVALSNVCPLLQGLRYTVFPVDDHMYPRLRLQYKPSLISLAGGMQVRGIRCLWQGHACACSANRA